MVITYEWLYSIKKYKFPGVIPVGLLSCNNEIEKQNVDELLKKTLNPTSSLMIVNKFTGIPLAAEENNRNSFFLVSGSVIARGRILIKIPFDLTPEFDYKTRFIPFLYYSPEDFSNAYPWAKEKEWKLRNPMIEVPCIGEFSIFISLETELPHSLKDIEAFHILDSYIYFNLKAYEAPIPFVFKDGELDFLFNRSA